MRRVIILKELRMNSFSANLSIEELEKDKWKEPDFFPTDLVEKCFKYRKIPVKDLTTEQLRTLIGQNIGLKYLIPLTIERLRNNVLAEGDFYPGDLLNAVITSEVVYWKANPVLHKTIAELIDSHLEILQQNISIRQFYRDIEIFKRVIY